MRYLALAADYDGTLASAGTVDTDTIQAIERLVASGRKLILVTGRVLPEILEIFPQISLCERVVAENGAVLYRPATKEITLLAPPPPSAFLEEVQRRKVEHLTLGNSIVATRVPYETVILDIIRDLGLELRIIFNKGAVMVLSHGINKATGLTAALKQLELSPHNIAAIGDGENDHAMLTYSEYAVAVENAVPMLKETADRTTVGDHGHGVIELINELVENDLAVADRSVARHRIALGTQENGGDITFHPARQNLLLAGTSGSGKSTLATGLLERLGERGYQLCVIDPEGDYENFPQAIVLGTAQDGPSHAEILTALANPNNHVVVNLVGLPLQDRPSFFLTLLPKLQELRSKSGRPHWMLVDETHHLLPVDGNPTAPGLMKDLAGMIYVTVHPDHIEHSILKTVDIVFALGKSPDETLKQYCAAIQQPAPAATAARLQPGRAIMWNRASGETPFVLEIAPSTIERRRHRRKYAEGELPPEQSFYFRGPAGQLNLRAHNLLLFMQLGEGVDQATWIHHLRSHDYSTWIKQVIKDEALAQRVHDVEQQAHMPAEESRQLIRSAIEERYTVPAGGDEHTS
ncbi:MAG: HAD family hydrolase [Nitrospira sp.]|jgi:hydroxymethylpyrimidine pyrophosphatase-like HAD family hydrolase|nr:HAD family hydrolase [Nitrospira sp.]MBP6206603.1 HAD family hydrolase [Nitrospira sp.]MBP8104538.1 HAD family hydrolase [Nitrospira sp.]MBP8199925.1 HAD family hydrolase [Nitrospira sp.]MBP9635639.1 HAD family hydrolase [Nitrospira sp.]